MRVPLTQVQRIAHLARLTLDDDAQKRHAVHLERILDHMQTLQNIPLDALPEALPATSALRPDEARVPTVPPRGLEQAPDREGDYFVVPRIVES